MVSHLKGICKGEGDDPVFAENWCNAEGSKKPPRDWLKILSQIATAVYYILKIVKEFNQ